MSERDALLRAILRDPACDTARLVFADWLQENGEEERAEFIRVQVELTANAEQAGLHQGNPAEQNVPCQACVYYGRLRARESDLFHAHAADPILGEGIFDGLRFTKHQFDLCELPVVGLMQRGFVSEIKLRCAEFMRHAAAIFAAHPVVSVKLTDKDCGDYDYERVPVWQKLSVTLKVMAEAGHDDARRLALGVPDEVFELMPNAKRSPFTDHGYESPNTYPPDRATGLQWLSDVCVCHGRQLAKLPALPEPAPV